MSHCGFTVLVVADQVPLKGQVGFVFWSDGSLRKPNLMTGQFVDNVELFELGPYEQLQLNCSLTCRV